MLHSPCAVRLISWSIYSQFANYTICRLTCLSPTLATMLALTKTMVYVDPQLSYEILAPEYGRATVKKV